MMIIKKELKKIFKNKKVLITGHTGFKGSWLVIWLKNLGADVYGISLEPDPGTKNLFDEAGVDTLCKSNFCDVTNDEKIRSIILAIQPEVVFHLAAQALVGEGYSDPTNTFSTNIMGTVNILQVIRELGSVKVVVMVTTDKVYKNQEWVWPYREEDPLGGIDPYSASKASAEILFNSYFKTFIENKNTKLRVCTARAGNVIGGGDWSKNRLIPDCMKMWLKNKIPNIRNPNSTRPWQHVLEALSGYLDLSLRLDKDKSLNGHSFNFSSDKIKNVTVLQFLKEIKGKWPEINWSVQKSNKFYESSLLQLDTSKVKKILKWKARLNLDETIEFVVNWYKNFQKNKKNTLDISRKQIIKFMKKKP